MTGGAGRRALPFRVASGLWLTVVWVLLWGDLSAANVLAGAVVAMAVSWVFPMPAVEFAGRVHLVPLAYLVVRFVGDLVVASTQVVVLALTPGREPRSAVIGVQLRSHSELYLTLTAELTSLVPGSIVVEAHRTTGMLYVHVLDVGLAGGLEQARHHVLDNEARVLRALASDAELADAGLARKPRKPRDTAEVTP